MISYDNYINLILTEGIFITDELLLEFLESAITICLLGEDENTLIRHNEFLSLHKSILKSGNSYLSIPYNTGNVKGSFSYQIAKKTLSSRHDVYVKTNRFPVLYVIVDEQEMRNDINKYIDYLKAEVQINLCYIIESFLNKRAYNLNYLTNDCGLESYVVRLIRNIMLNVKNYFIQNNKPMSINNYENEINKTFTGNLNDDFGLFLFCEDQTKRNYKYIVNSIHKILMDNIKELQSQGYLEKD